MAEGKSRKHLSHNVQVFLLGIATLLSRTELRAFMLQDIKKNVFDGPDGEVVYLGIIAWACFATTHDVGYLVEKGTEVCLTLSRLSNKLDQMRGKGSRKLGFAFRGPLLKMTHHAIVGRDIWRRCGGSPIEQKIAALVAAGIERHDCGRAVQVPVHSSEWLSFAAVLCDELQDWERFRPDAVPGNEFGESPWHVFSLSEIVIGETTGAESLIFLGFVASWNYDELAEEGGTVGLDKVKSRLDKILKGLERNLRTSFGFTIKLQVRMLSAKGTSETSTKKLKVVPA